jgi:hypothetical protein
MGMLTRPIRVADSPFHGVTKRECHAVSRSVFAVYEAVTKNPP